MSVHGVAYLSDFTTFRTQDQISNSHMTASTNSELNGNKWSRTYTPKASALSLLLLTKEQSIAQQKKKKSKRDIYCHKNAHFIKNENIEDRELQGAITLHHLNTISSLAKC